MRARVPAYSPPLRADRRAKGLIKRPYSSAGARVIDDPLNATIAQKVSDTRCWRPATRQGLETNPHPLNLKKPDGSQSPNSANRSEEYSIDPIPFSIKAEYMILQPTEERGFDHTGGAPHLSWMELKPAWVGAGITCDPCRLRAWRARGMFKVSFAAQKGLRSEEVNSERLQGNGAKIVSCEAHDRQRDHNVSRSTAKLSKNLFL